MGRFLIFLSYIGTNYSGFQKQSKQQAVKTIQGQLDVALKIFNPANEIKTFTSSRTDAGVHGLENTLHVDLIHKIQDTEYDPEYLKIGLNYWLRRRNESIVVTNLLRVPDDFHCRMKVVNRTYMYRLAIPWKTIADHRVYSAMNLFESKRAQILFKPVNIEKLMACAETMVGTHDFTSFTTIKSLREANQDPIRTVSVDVKLGSSFLKNHNPGFEFWEVHITSRSFLYRQIRRMMGTMIQTSLGDFTLDDVKQMLLDPDLKNTNTKIKPSPPHGLYLKKVQYNPKDLIYNPNDHPIEDGYVSTGETNSGTENDT